jgi:hypothetical protein
MNLGKSVERNGRMDADVCINNFISWLLHYGIYYKDYIHSQEVEMYRHLTLALVLINLLGPLACSASESADPFAYCAAVGTIDTPDTRYKGPKTPDAIVHGLMKVMEISADASVAPFARLTTWRCMNGKVVACNFGANIPCRERADTKRTPNPGMKEFCHANSASDMIPAYITGRATVYEWRCTNGTPTIVKQVTYPDARGFLSIFWYEINK